MYRFFDFMKYYSKLGRCFVRNLIATTLIDFPLDLFSAWIDEGLFGTPIYSIASFMKSDIES